MIGRIILVIVLVDIGFLPTDYLDKGFDLRRCSAIIMNRFPLHY